MPSLPVLLRGSGSWPDAGPPKPRDGQRAPALAAQRRRRRPAGPCCGGKAPPASPCSAAGAARAGRGAPLQQVRKADVTFEVEPELLEAPLPPPPRSPMAPEATPAPEWVLVRPGTSGSCAPALAPEDEPCAAPAPQGFSWAAAASPRPLGSVLLAGLGMGLSLVLEVGGAVLEASRAAAPPPRGGGDDADRSAPAARGGEAFAEASLASGGSGAAGGGGEGEAPSPQAASAAARSASLPASQQLSSSPGAPAAAEGGADVSPGQPLGRRRSWGGARPGAGHDEPAGPPGARCPSIGMLELAHRRLEVELALVEAEVSRLGCACGTAFVPGSKFCRRCGEKRPDLPEAPGACDCGTAFPAGARFCKRCGCRRPWARAAAEESEVAAELRERCLRLGAAFGELSGGALEGGCGRQAGAMDLFERANAALDRVATCLQQCEGAERSQENC
ncbi:unnamed protein product [Prorocentrum cordatum]|uniref:Uncharacterized protein n=1 Tax=Prorocentrum cordatum TaxID=2364126 RepID=A0ABN9SQ21_9DINO|nr:unnamed protein product [Polarella glacialis]